MWALAKSRKTQETRRKKKKKKKEVEEEEADGGGRKSCCQASVSAAFIKWRLEDTLDVCFQRRVKSGLGPHWSEEWEVRGGGRQEEGGKVKRWQFGTHLCFIQIVTMNNCELACKLALTVRRRP